MPPPWSWNPRPITAMLSLLAANIPAQTAPDLLLTNAAQIRQLPPAVAAQGIAARVRGIVTYYDRPNRLAFVQDVTAGTYVDPEWRTIATDPFTNAIHAGLLVELSGRTREGRFAPYLSHEPTALILGQAESFPEPLRPLRRLLLDPTFHSQWVELDVFVRAAKITAGRLLLRCAFGPSNFDAHVAGSWQGRPVPPNLIKSDIRIRGVYGSIFNDRGQLVDMRLFVPSTDQITVLDPGMSLAFAQAPIRIGEIMQFNPHPSERVHLRGTVVAHFPGEAVYVRGEDGALRIETVHEEPLEPGQGVDVIGFPRAGELRPLLLDAVVKPGRAGPPPTPLDLLPNQVADQPVDGDLIRVEARLVDHFERPGNSLLLLQSDGTTFHARLVDQRPLPKSLTPGAWLRLTGICLLASTATNTDEEPDGSLRRSLSKPVGFSLILRGRDDLEVLQTPPWWTPGRIRLAGLLLAGVTGAVLLWGALLRRKVREQTAVITGQIERERVTEERARIARELHDSLEQQLVGITMQLDTAASRIEHAPDRARHALDLARAMLRRSQTEARQSVWDLRAADLAQTPLDQALRESIGPLGHAEGPSIHIHTEGSYPTRLDGVAKNHLLRIAQESVTNALKHARAKHIRITLTALPGQVELAVIDDGQGFTETPRNDAHFGLLGLRERAAKLGASLAIESRPGHGTTVRLSVPQTS